MRGRRTLRAPALGGLLVAVLSPAVAEAQLFPNLATRNRERIDCSQELPVYGLYRHKYHGYYPTCWRQYPPGWGCPSSESPDWEAELARQPLDIPEEGDLGLEGLGGPGGPGADPFGPGPDEDMLPELPRRPSPFDLDEPGAGASPFDQPSPSRPASPFDQPAPSRAPSPFDVDPFAPETPGGEAPGRSNSPDSPFDVPGASASPSPSELPSLAPPVTEADATGGDSVAMAPPLAAIPELAVLPDVRPRPVQLSADSTAPAAMDQPIPTAPVGMIPGTSTIQSSPMGLPPGMAPHPTTISPMGSPAGRADPGPHGVVISDPSFSGGDPVLMAPPEGRPRRRFLSGLFGRRD